MLKTLFWLGALALLASPASAEPAHPGAQVLDAFHAAAARADEETYLGLLTPDAVFLGTDATERWQAQAFRTFVSEAFAGGTGWTYHSRQRRIDESADGRLAWFDELLDNRQLGTCRGSGVLVNQDGAWRIAQYNLSVPIPNHLVKSVVADIRADEGGGATAATETVAGEGEDMAADPDLEEPQADEPKKCRKRFKTNRQAKC